MVVEGRERRGGEAPTNEMGRGDGRERERLGGPVSLFMGSIIMCQPVTDGGLLVAVASPQTTQGPTG
jgi:hypothetical protein